MRVLFLLLLLVAYSDCGGTINVVVKTNDGIVAAADSRITHTDKKLVRVATDHYQKIFRLSNRVGASLAGNSFIFDEDRHYKSIAGILREFAASDRLHDDSSFDSVLSALDSYLTGTFNSNALNRRLGETTILVFGYDNRLQRRLVKMVYPKLDTSTNDIAGALYEESPTPGCKISGQLNTFARLVKGIDPMILQTEFYRDNATVLDSLFDEMRLDVRYDLMTLQDAIDFALFLVRATIESQRFNMDATPGVGGCVDIAVITPDGFQWIKKKALAADLE